MVDNKAALDLIQRAGQLKHLAGRHDQKSHAGSASLRIVDSYESVRFELNFGKGYYILKDGNILDVGEAHVPTWKNREARKLLGLSDQDAEDLDRLSKNIWSYDYTALILKLQSKIKAYGTIRVREELKDVSIETDALNDSTLHKLQRLYDNRKLGLIPRGNVIWDTGGDDYLQCSTEDFLSAKHVNELRPRFKALKDFLALVHKRYG